MTRRPESREASPSVGAHIGQPEPPAPDAKRQPDAAREAVARPAEAKLPGADREWVPKLELPKGGGAIKATGEKLESIAFTGSASYSIPIATSPGRGGAAPQLGLAYSSGGGNGPFGTGWSLGVPAIARKTERELPQYADGRESDTFVLAGLEDLVPLCDDAGLRVVRERPEFRVYPYRPRTEGAFSRIERWVRRTDGDTRWRVLSRDNATAWFGVDPQARIADPSDAARVFAWLLESSEDDRGNVTRYVYKADDDPEASTGAVAEINRGPTTQRLLARVLYGNRVPGVAAAWMFEVVFDYGEYGTVDAATGRVSVEPEEVRPWSVRADAFSTFRAGFDVRTRRLCRRVLMFHHFPEELGAASTLVRSTDFEYDDAPHLAKLVRVVQRAYERHPDGSYAVAEFPATSFGYTEARVQPELRELDAESLRNLPHGLDGGFRLLDLDGDGLPGIVAQLGDALHYKAPLGGGRFGALAIRQRQTTTAKLGQDGQLVDLDGDGRPELMRLDAQGGGYYGRTGTDDDWSRYRPFAQRSTFDLGDPNLRQVDLDADGLPDLLVSRGDHFVWVPSLGTEGYGRARLVAKPRDERDGPAVVFDDPTGRLFFADMTGDGLQDIVRIDHGAIHYWPNLGRGDFGRRITMQDAPQLAAEADFDPRRVRLADIDGSGTTDVIYLDHRGARAWFNLSGNGFSEATPLRPFPRVGATTAVEVVDLLGKGTACLMWSERGAWAGPDRVKYLDLMGDKPHLLVSVDNGMGLQTRVRYEASTAQALRDRASGQGWITRLPFPVYVVTRVEQYDQVARRRFVQRSSYHHGYFDAVEREFHGFARVERWDTEGYEDFEQPGLFELATGDGVERQLHQPPVHTRSWFHTGAYFGAQGMSERLRAEYWGGDPQAWGLPETVLPAVLDPEECREAVRALRGRLLREEVYGLDGSELEGVPYTVTHANAGVRRVQARGGNKHAVFFVHDREALSYSYDRVAADPRVSHTLVLEVDAYGNVTRQMSVGYPRRVVPVGLPEQGRRTVVLAEASFAGIDDPVAAPDVLRIGVPTGARSYEVLGLPEGAPMGVDGARAGLIGAVIEAPEFAAPIVDGLVHLRLLEAERTLYYADGLGGALPWGACGTRALPFELQAAAFSDGQVAAVYGAEVDAALLGEAGYVHDEGLWWARSMRHVFDAARFFVPVEVHDAFGNPPTRVAYDDSVLFATSVTDAMGNVVSAEHDYRVVAPRVVIDANGSRGGVVFDGRGMVVATYVAGRPGSGLGDTPEDPTSTMDYDLFAWRDRGEPNVVHTRTRERHGDPTTRWLEQWVYSDGSGHEILRKASAEPGDAPLRGEDGALVLGPDGAPVIGPADPRYVGTGRTVFDNKGQVVKQYEPYFSRTPGYESEVELREHGVTAIVHYDVVGRVVRTELPNGTFSRTEHGGWVQRAWDPNDTVLESAWFAERAGGALGVAEQRAAVLTAAHADTPTTVHVDALGRTCLIEEHAGFAGDPAVAVLHETRLLLDVVGNVVAVIDARGNTAEARVFGMLGQVLRTDSEDAGWRVGLADVAGGVVRSWNARGFTTRVQYDSLRRATHQFVTPPEGDEIVVARTVYGEQVAEPARTDANLRGRVFRVYDGAGVVTNAAYDFEGNLLAQERRLAVAFATTQDWSVLDGAVPPIAEGIAALAEAELEAEVFATVSEYDALHRVTSSTNPDGSQTLSTYNDAGLLEAVAVRIRGAATPTTFVSGFDYDARGQRQRCVHGNGTVTTYVYDPRTFRLVRLRLVRDADSAVLQDLRYTYDPVGNITEIRDGAQQAVYFANAVVSADQRFEYDAVYRLVRAEGREHASLGQPTDADFTFGPQPHADDPSALRRYEQEYAWDEVGNLAELRHVAGSGSFTRRYVYAAAGNRLLANSAPGEAAPPFSHSYTYDAHGNMTSMPHLAAIAWDHADRMQHADLGGGGDVWFVYDAAGERVRKVQVNGSGSTVRERVYLGGYEVYRERAANSAAPEVERQTLHVGDDRGKLALVETLTIDGGEPVRAPSSIQRHQHGNHLGSASLELDEDAAVISYEEFHPFGTTSYAANDAGIEVSAKRYRYIGKERDEESGLYYLGARYYASWLGRWTATDPIGLGDGVNRYAYARGNPVSLKDATGTFAAPHAEIPPLTQADLTTKSDEEIRRHPTYFDEGIAGITYYGEDKQATIEYEGGEILTVDTSDIRTQPRSTITPGTVAFGVKPEDLNEPEVEAAYTIDEPSGRVVPGEINIENAPNFTALLKEGRRQFDTGTRSVGEAGVAVYSDWRFQALVLSPSPNQLLAPTAATPSISATRTPRAAVPVASKTAEIALGLGSHRGKKGSQTLANFAQRTKSWWYRQWAEEGIAAPRAGETLMSPGFLQRGMQAATRIHFNLDGLAPEAFKAFAKNPKFGYGNITNWELYQVLKTDLARKTTFYGKGGGKVSLETVRRLYQ